MEKFELIYLKESITLRSLDFKETFHPTVGPKMEANRLHVEQQRLRERADQAQKFILWDVGLGAAANALVALEALETCANPVEIHSFDRNLDSLDFALAHKESLNYLIPHELLIAELLKKNEVRFGANGRWIFHAGDFRKTLLENLPAPHAVIYDPYSPAKNGDMWNLEHFTNLYTKCSEPFLWTNYTRSTAVRVTLLLAGFYVGVGRSIGTKAETTVATNKLDWLDAPLGKSFLKRVQESRNSSPIIGQEYSQSTISMADFEKLRNHPQFQEEK